MAKLILIVALIAGCQSTAQDSCQRAFARLDRISKHPMAGEFRDQALDQCRHGKYAAYDPVLRCAMDSSSDEAAAACIDEGIKTVVKPGAEPGTGKNPLMP